MGIKLIRAEKVNKINDRILVNVPDNKLTPEKTHQPLDVKQQETISMELVKQETQKLREFGEREYLAKIKGSEEESKKIIQLAETEASNCLNSAKEESKKKMNEAALQAKKVIEEAKVEADSIVKKEGEDKRSEIIKSAHDQGYAEGKEKGLIEGRDVLNSMVSHLKKIIGETINKRNEIIESSEKQLSNIVVAIAKKVVKAISETDKSVILKNVSEALKKVKGRAKVTIRVNLSDLEIVTKHKDDFCRMLDDIENVDVLEDPNIEKGGCIIETDFGDIDARISAQLDEIEMVVRNVHPIKDL